MAVSSTAADAFATRLSAAHAAVLAFRLNFLKMPHTQWKGHSVGVTADGFYYIL